MSNNKYPAWISVLFTAILLAIALYAVFVNAAVQASPDSKTAVYDQARPAR